MFLDYVDIMCIVNDLKIAEKKLIQIGYKSKGELNLPLRLFFSKKHPHDVHIHVVKENSVEFSFSKLLEKRQKCSRYVCRCET